MDGYRVAVVGGGVFGVTAATHLARAGHEVVLFEACSDLLMAASDVNQRRLHRGYHYPRSEETVTSVLRGVESFETEYPDAVRRDYDHYVAIGRRDSLVSAEQYLSFCERMGLACREEYPAFLRRSSVETSLRVEEHAIDIDVLRKASWQKLRRAGVDVRLRSRRTVDSLADFDAVVLATYASLNDGQSATHGGAVDYQYEVCEKPVVRLPEMYRDHSMVILDGPFMCVDPYDGNGRFLLGNVVHAIHATTVGRHPLIPAGLVGNLNRGVGRPQVTKLPAFLAHGREFLHGLEDAEHLGSLFTVRTVLPNVEKSDSRPTIVRSLDDRTFAVFSGKIATCVDAAKDVTARVAATGGSPQRRQPVGLAV